MLSGPKIYSYTGENEMSSKKMFMFFILKQEVSVVLALNFCVPRQECDTRCIYFAVADGGQFLTHDWACLAITGWMYEIALPNEKLWAD